MILDGASVMNRVCEPQSQAPSNSASDVQLRTIDSFCGEHCISAIDILKIDAEGYDLHVLHGAAGLLERQSVGVIYVEAGLTKPPDVQVPFEDIHAELTKHGYSLFGFYDQVNEWKVGSPALRRLDAAYLNAKHSRAPQK